MFFKKNRNNSQNSFSNMYNPNNYNNFYQNPYEDNRIMLEIKENRRRINNLAKRIVRLENYLRIRDTSDFSILDDEIKD